MTRLLPALFLGCLLLMVAPAAGQTLTDTLGGAAIQSELQAQQAGGAGNGQQQQQQDADAASAASTAPPAARSAATPGPAPEPAVLLSPWKPILLFLVFLGWGWVISHLDKDAAYYYLARTWWNLGQMACGVLALAMMLLIPFFLVGLLIGILILAGGILGYAYYRNTKVPENARWTLSLDSLTQRVEGYQHRRAQGRAAVVFMGKDESRHDVPSGDDPRAEAHATLENVLDFAIPRGADQAQIEVNAQQATMAVRIDGVLYPQPQPEPKQAVVLIDYLKSVAGLDLQDRRKRQHGVIHLDAGELGRHTLEVETSGSTRGLMMTMDIDATRRKQMPIQMLGLTDSQRAQVQQLLEEPGKVVLVTAPPRHGLTTTLYSLLAQHDPYTSSVITMEKEVTLELEGVTHTEMGDATPQQWNEKLAAILRSDPNVALLDHFPDADTAGLVARNGEEIRIYVGMAEDDTFSTLQKWIKLAGGRKLAGSALGAITSQRLVRKLCMTCRTPYKPDPQALRKLNLPADRVGQLYHASGQVMERDKAVPCPDCMGLGYKGRIAVFELMVLDDDARSMVAAGELDRLRSHLRKQRMLWLQEAGLTKVVEGVTDVKEITRTLGGGGSRRPSSGGGSTPRPNPASTAPAAGGAA